jgi:hypothetical protein
MLNINSNEKKKLKFGISVAGVQARDLRGALRLTVEGVEYGFPVTIVEGDVEVEIPPLRNLIAEVDAEKRYEVKLELIANDTYIIPWQDVAKIKTPVRVEVSESIQEEDEKVEEVKIGVTKVDEEDIKEAKTQKETEKMMSKHQEKERFKELKPKDQRKIKELQKLIKSQPKPKSKFRKMLEK